MATAEAILLTLCIFVFIPLILGLTVERIIVAAYRRKRDLDSSGKHPEFPLRKERNRRFL